MILLSLLLAGLGLFLLRRHPGAVMVILVCVASSGVLWAMITFDGDPGDWVSAPFLDPADPLPDLRAGFAEADATDLFFRFDAFFTSPPPANTPPIADPQALATGEDTALPITLTGSDADGDTLTFSIITPPINGSLGPLTQMPPTSATVTYTPNLNYTGNDSFTFQVDDGNGGMDTATVDITVNAGNAPPVANPQMVMGNEDTALPLVLTGSDVDGDTLTFSIVTPPTNGSLGAVTQTPPTSATVTYTPNLNFNGSDSFTFQVDDGNGGMDTATVDITVNAANDPPVANPQMVMGNEDTALPLVLTGSDVDGDTLTFTIVTPPTNGSLGAVTQTPPTSATVTYTPNLNYTGSDSFTFQVDDGNGGMDTATIDITVNPLNDVPVANPQMVMTDEDVALPLVLTGADPEGDALTVTIVTPPANGSLGAITQMTPTPQSAQVTYTPDPDFFGADSFTFTVSDGGPASAPATVDITVNAVNDAPSFTVGADQAADRDAGAQSVVGWATALSPGPANEAGQTLTFLVTGNTNPGLFSAGPAVDSSGTLTFTPQGTAVGTATISLRLMDSGGTLNGGVDQSAIVTFDITINDVPAGVVYGAFGNTELVAGGAAARGVVSTSNANGVLAGTTGLTVTGTSGVPAGASLVMNADGSFSYVPSPGVEGSEGFTYTVNTGRMATVTVNLSEMVWYVDNEIDAQNPAGGNGTSLDPFDGLTALQAAATNHKDAVNDVGDVIYVFPGAALYDHTAADADGIDLAANNQRLIGGAADLVVGATTLIAGNAANRPQITNSTAAAHGVTAQNLTGIEIRGLDIDGDTNAVLIETTGTGAAGVLVDNNVISGAGSEGIRVAHAGSGRATVTVSGNTIAADGNAFDAVKSGAGDLEIAFDNNTDITSANAAGAAVRIEDTAGTGSLFVTGFANNAVLGSTAGDGVRILGAIFDANPADADFDLVSAGSLTIGALADRTGRSGAILGMPASRVAGNLSFGTLNAFSGNGAALAASGTGAAAGGPPPTSGFSLAIAAGTTDGIGGPAVSLDPLTANVLLTSASSSGSTVAGIFLDTVSGTFSAAGGSITTSTGPGFEIVGGTVSTTYSGGITQTTNAPAVFVRGGHGTGTVTFNSGTVSATAGTGLQFDNADGTYNFNGTTTLNGGDAGVDILNGSSGTFNFATAIGSAASITNPTGTAFNIVGGTAAVTYSGDISQANNAATVSISGHATGSVRFDTGTLGVTGGSGLQFSNADGTYEFEGTTTLNGGDAGLDILAGSSGNFDFATEVGATASITNPTGTALNVDTGTPGVTYDGTITNAAGRSVSVTNVTGGTIAINGAVDDNGGAGVVLNNNAGGTINLTGGMALDTGANNAFTATGGGTVNVTGTNTIGNTTAISGVGVNIANTMIGGSGVTFQSIDVNGATNGIVLNATNAGAFNVTGDGASDPLDTTRGRTTAAAGGGSLTLGSGGTIQNCTGPHVSLVNADNVTLRNLVIQDVVNPLNDGSDGIDATSSASLVLDNVLITGHAGNHGLDGAALSNLTLIHTEISSNATAAGVEMPDVWNVRFDNLTGAVAIDHSLFHTSRENIMGVLNNGGTLNVTVNNSEFRDTSTLAAGNVGLLFDLLMSATINADITGSSFLRNRARGVQFLSNSGSTNGSLDVMTSTFEDNFVGIDVAHQSAGQTVTFDIRGNTLNQNATTTESTAINVILGGLSSATTVLRGTLDGNTIGTGAIASSGSAQGAGFLTHAQGSGTLTARVVGNTVRSIAIDNGFATLNNDGDATLNLTFSDNDFAVNAVGFPLAGLDIQAGAVATDSGTTCVAFPVVAPAMDPNIAFIGEAFTGGVTAQILGGTPIIELVGYGGADNDTGAIETFLASTATTVMPAPFAFPNAGTIRGRAMPCPLP